MPANSIDPIVAKNMAYVLNQRGFLTHDDFPLCNDDDFGRYVCEQEDVLRGYGYTGGTLESWSTSFRISMAFTYGILDSDNRPPDSILDAYTLATGLQVEHSELIGHDLQRLLIGLIFECDCGNQMNVDPQTVPFRQQSLRINQISAVCGKCNHHIEFPCDTYRLFQGIP